MWVDNHDEAMDWAKNKVFYWNENTQTAQIFTSSEEFESQENKNVEVQTLRKVSNLFSAYSESQLIAIGVPDAQLKLVYSIRDLNELGQAEKYLPTDVFERLFYLTEGANIELLIAEIKEGKLNTPNADEQINSMNNKRSFVEVDDELMNEIINGDLSKWQIFLHPSQRKLVESTYKGAVKVTGGAGTGKTVVALHRLKYLSSLPMNGDNRKIVFTTFTNALTVNLTSLAQKLSIDTNKVLITNIDSLVREMAKSAHLIDNNVRVLDMYNGKSSNELWEEILEQNLSAFDAAFLNAEYQQTILFNNINSLAEYLKVSRNGRGKPITRKQKMEVWALVELYQKKKKTEAYMDRSELFNLTTNYVNGLAEKPFK